MMWGRGENKQVKMDYYVNFWNKERKNFESISIKITSGMYL
jgi:hypothetical protein